MSTPALHLATLYESDAGGRLTTTREPARNPASIFVLVRSTTTVAWGIRAGVPDALAEELATLARDEPPVRDLHDLPKHVERYRALGAAVWFGPAGYPRGRPSVAEVSIDGSPPTPPRARVLRQAGGASTVLVRSGLRCCRHEASRAATTTASC